MASWARKELARLKFYKPSKRLLLPPPLNLQPSHDGDDSSTLSQVQEVVLAADLRCATCQKRMTDAISSIDDIESMVVLVREKKVIVTSKTTGKVSSTKVAAISDINPAAGRPSGVPLKV
ncbi:uncharacterized protein LOC8268635 [Ricinus communis]|uniref:HMA domain-containing protein n=1 Tax=Ricinus communis TaxID=3988 RepID=B9T330_RICCO|nr:uncharacterized protein LOC8268635 [Ricinus communis]EEF29722.1 conserved hypothetical protein [Ricinus communis]|eukprot:XP_002532649.1 uncharacterized protein LOC8268635 [Ricinus communis]